MALQATQDVARQSRRSVLVTGIILGVGVVGSLDEILFHQILQWHNFYVDASERWRIISDGLFHTLTVALLVYGALRLWDTRHEFKGAGAGRALAAGVLFGMGGFNLWDGIVNHKILRLHPVREGAEQQWPYDVSWIALSLILLLAGWALWRAARPAGEDGR